MAALQDNCCASAQHAPIFPSSPSASAEAEPSRQIVAYGFRPGRKRRFSLCIDPSFAGEGMRSRFQPIWVKPDTSESKRNVLAFLVWEREFWPEQVEASAYSVVVEMGALPRPGSLVWLRVDSPRQGPDHAMGELRLARYFAPGHIHEVRGGHIGRHRHPCVLGVVIEERFYTDRPAVISLQGGAR